MHFQQVSPSEIENVILKLPDVVEVSVIGIPNEIYGEVPRAYVVASKEMKAQTVS